MMDRKAFRCAHRLASLRIDFSIRCRAETMLCKRTCSEFTFFGMLVDHPLRQIFADFADLLPSCLPMSVQCIVRDGDT